MPRDNAISVESVWVANRGAACTPASVLIALGLLGVPDLPELGAASIALGAAAEFGAPGLLDYITLPGRRSPLDLAIERLAAERGAPVRSLTTLHLPWPPPAARPGEVLIGHLAWGQERPGVYGTWGFHPLDRATWSTGGHSVVVLEGGRGPWQVVDPNHPGIQAWPEPGVAVTATRLRRASPPR